jgi:hypothetical protein
VPRVPRQYAERAGQDDSLERRVPVGGGIELYLYRSEAVRVQYDGPIAERFDGCDEGANALLPEFMADYNERFAKEPRDPKNLHRPLLANDRLDDVFAWREERTVSNSLTLQYNKVLFLLEPSEISCGLRHKRVTVADYPNGQLKIRHNGVELPYRVMFDKVRHVSQGDIVENKRLSAVLSHIRCRQQQYGEQRSNRSPRRQDQSNHLFKVG